MDLFGKMELNSYLCRAKKETLRIIPQQFLVRQHDTVQLTYPRQGRGIGLAVNGQALCLDISFRLYLHRHYVIIHLKDKFHFCGIA